MTVSQILGALALTWMTAFALSLGLDLDSFAWPSGIMMFLAGALAVIAKSIEE